MEKENKTNKGIIYCRVSSHEQTKGTSLENQKRACLDYSESKGIKVVKIFVEKGESATAANRTELIKALDYCKNNKNQIAAFIVWKIDRFARNLTDHYGLQAQLLKYGTSLHSVTEEIISQGPVGKMMEAMLAGYAQFENDIRKQRCEGGMKARLRDGIWMWTPPIGYINAKKLVDRRKTRPDEPDPERFFLVQKGLKAYRSGKYTIIQLTKASNQWGLKTRTGLPMRKQLWEKILTNKFYAGIIVDPWTGEESVGQHKPMVTVEEYNDIQRIKRGLSNNATAPRLHQHPDFPLRRFVRCVCNHYMTASWQKGRNKRYPSYKCNKKECSLCGHTIAKKDLEKTFVELLQRVTPDEKFIALLEKSVLANWNDKHMALKQESSHYERGLKRLKGEKAELTQMRISREISKEDFIKHKEDIENRMIGLETSRNEAKIDELDIETTVLYTKLFLRNVARWWQDVGVEQQQRLQRLVLPNEVVYNKTDGEFGTAVLSPIFKLSEQFDGDESDFVAGAGIAPASGGYEPPDLLLVHPAGRHCIKKEGENQIQM